MTLTPQEPERTHENCPRGDSRCWVWGRHYGCSCALELDEVDELRAEVRRLLEREKAARAEGMMDASWLIWEKVVASASGINVVRKCREVIEAEAERLSPGVKLPWQRAAISALNPGKER